MLSQDYFSVADEDIRQIEAELTVMDGRVVYAQGDFRAFDLAQPMPLPEWSPVNYGSGCWRQSHHAQQDQATASSSRDGGRAQG